MSPVSKNESDPLNEYSFIYQLLKADAALDGVPTPSLNNVQWKFDFEAVENKGTPV